MMTRFLKHLGASHSVAAAARSVGMSRQSAYRLRNRLKGSTFDLAWEATYRHAFDQLAQAALERALNGVEVPHYHKGELVGTSRRYDERLTLALLTRTGPSKLAEMRRMDGELDEWGGDWDGMLRCVEAEFGDGAEEQQKNALDKV
jgi:molybdenum-dependent DNA-binding transcriptional regulator ModE